MISLTELAESVSENPSISGDDMQCYFGQKAAERILKDIDDINEEKAGKAKSVILPCQSNVEARQEIAALEKEMFRQTKQKDDTTLESYTANIKEKIWKIKLQEIQHPISDTFKYFLQCLISLEKDDRKYFLQSLKLGLNDRSVQYLEPLYQKYAQCRLEDDSEEKDQKLQEIDKQLNHGSLGLEHFFREMAVVHDYLWALERRVRSANFSKVKRLLKTAMAEVFMDGTAIEIMDEDAVTVPVKWISSVLHKVQKSLNKATNSPSKITKSLSKTTESSRKTTKLFKISVLGAQSCGKSTLLNTVFGLNFPVSSGRCTRGAYMQLVKVDGELEKILGCDYVLVIDSEGLMSRAFSNRSDYDNELSTFVIGLSDLTLVIIKGEGNEMQDVLPLAIHVFLRMKLVGEHQACHFVHQNMGAVDAMSKVATEIDAFVRDLNMKTLAAATDAKRSSQYRKFTDILRYDPNKDNIYVPGLWDGTPPMGKTNAEYSATMQTLKIHILNFIMDMQKKKKPMSKMEDFTKRLHELWEAIKLENFVFSFKNVLAFEAHKKLTWEFDEEQWEMKCEVWEKTKQEKTAITKEVNNTSNDINLRDLIKNSIKDITEFIEDTGAEMKQKILHYFNCTNGCDECNNDVQNRHLLARYQDEFQKDVDILTKNLVQDLNVTMDKFKLKLNADKTFNQMKSEMHGHMKNTIQNLVDSKKQVSMRKTDMDKIFKDFWKKEANDILQQIKVTDELNPTTIKARVESTIKRLLKTDVHVYTRTRSQDDKDKKKQIVKGKSEKRKNPLQKEQSLDSPKPNSSFQVQRGHFTKREVRERSNSSQDKDEVSKTSDETATGVASGTKTKMIGFVKKKINRGADKEKEKRETTEGSSSLPNNDKEEMLKTCEEPETEVAPGTKTKMIDFMKKRIKGTDKDIHRLTEITEEIIKQTRKHYEDDPKAFTDKEAENLFKEVLRLINEIDEDRFEITDEYKGDLILHIESLAIEDFTDMHTTYMENNSPEAILAKMEQNYCTLFMMEMEQGANAALEFCKEVLHGVTLQNVFEQMNRAALFNDLRENGNDIFKKIRSLQATVMVELIKNNNFDSYMKYIVNYEACLAEVLGRKSIEHFEKENRLQILAKKFAEQIIHTILEAIDETVDNSSEEATFVKLLLDNMKGLTVSQDYARPFEDLKISDWKQFGIYLHKNLSQTVKKNIFEDIERRFNVEVYLNHVKLTEFILEQTVSCRAKCPFCHVPCDFHSGGRTQGNHSATMHRPTGIVGYKHKNDKSLFTESCDFLVASKEKFKIRDGKAHLSKYKPFKEYQKYHPRWFIQGNADSDVEKYWKWVLAEHNTKFAKRYGTKEANIPEEWYIYDTEEIIMELKETYLDEDEISDSFYQ